MSNTGDKTLDEWFPDGRGDGRKFHRADWGDRQYFVPYFRANDGNWHGLGENGTHYMYVNNSLLNVFSEHHPPRKTRKVIMYKPVYHNYSNHYRTFGSENWHTDKESFPAVTQIVGWLSQEVEVEE